MRKKQLFALLMAGALTVGMTPAAAFAAVDDTTILSVEEGALEEVEEELVETPTEAPVETPTEAPSETPSETPTETPTETPSEAPTEAPTDTPMANSRAFLLPVKENWRHRPRRQRKHQLRPKLLRIRL